MPIRTGIFIGLSSHLSLTPRAPSNRGDERPSTPAHGVSRLLWRPYERPLNVESYLREQVVSLILYVPPENLGQSHAVPDLVICSAMSTLSRKHCATMRSRLVGRDRPSQTVPSPTCRQCTVLPSIMLDSTPAACP